MKNNNNKSIIVIATIAHILVILPIIFFASKEGMLGTKMKQLSVIIVPKTKIVEETPKPKIVEEVKQVPILKEEVINNIPKVSSPIIENKSDNNAIIEAPAANEIPALDFSDGAKEVVVIKDSSALYKVYIQSFIKNRWTLPDNDGIIDLKLNIDKNGQIISYDIINKTDKEWENSVVKAFENIKQFPKPPPKNFPLSFIVRFDVGQQ